MLICVRKKKLANKSNNLFVNLSLQLKRLKIYLINISTDQVYSGKVNHIENFTNL